MNPAENPSFVQAAGIMYIMIDFASTGVAVTAPGSYLPNMLWSMVLCPSCSAGRRGRGTQPACSSRSPVGILVLVDEAERVAELVQHDPDFVVDVVVQPAEVHGGLRLRKSWQSVPI